MNIKLLIIIIFSYAYGFFELFMGFRQRFKRKKSVIKSGDKGSIWLLFLLIGLGFWLSFMIGTSKTGRIYHWNTFFIIGSILSILGLIIRISAILTLKQLFTYSVKKMENHDLVESGLYKNIRHPGYLGQLFIFLGIATSMSNWLSIIGMMVPVLIGYINRIRVEEKFMKEQMGIPYIDYQDRTNRLIPKIY
jgi:protein-S-isoprenylcysteine O-methyltransferase Ste14